MKLIAAKTYNNHHEQNRHLCKSVEKRHIQPQNDEKTSALILSLIKTLLHLI